MKAPVVKGKKYQFDSRTSEDYSEICSHMQQRSAEGWEVMTVEYTVVPDQDGRTDRSYMHVCLRKEIEDEQAEEAKEEG